MPSLFDQQAGPQPPREVRTAIEILSLLKNIQQRHDPLSITFTDRAQRFQSYIVKIDADSQHLWIDEMMPRDGDRYMAIGEPFRLETWVEGVHIRWHCPGAEAVMLDETPAYRAALPQELSYHQKRGAFRAAIRRSQDIGIGIAHAKSAVSLTGSVMDISATGCKARVPGDCSHMLAPGDEFAASYLQLPDNRRSMVNLEVRHVSYAAAIDETQVGLRFKQPNPLIQRQIDRFVNLLQREARRLEKDDLF